MKKIILLSALLLSTLALTGCNSNNDDSSDEVEYNKDTTNPNVPEIKKDSTLTLNEIADSFYDPSNWDFMYQNNGTGGKDGGNSPAISDGSMNFKDANQYTEIGDLANKKISFIINGEHDWDIRLRSKNASNNGDEFIRLECQYNILRVKTSKNDRDAIAYVPAYYKYKVGEQNRIDIEFKDEGDTTTFSLWVNEVKVKFKIATVFDYVKLNEEGSLEINKKGFTLGNYFVLKCWDFDGAKNSVAIKPVSKDLDGGSTDTRIPFPYEDSDNDLKAGFFASPNWFDNGAITGTSQEITTVYSFQLKSDFQLNGDGGVEYIFRDDNASTDREAYKLELQWGSLFFQKLSTGGSWLGESKNIDTGDGLYKKDEYNRIDIVMKDTFDGTGLDTKCEISLYLNGYKLALSENTNATSITYNDGNMIDSAPAKGGNMYISSFGNDGKPSPSKDVKAI